MFDINMFPARIFNFSRRTMAGQGAGNAPMRVPFQQVVTAAAAPAASLDEPKSLVEMVARKARTFEDLGLSAPLLAALEEKKLGTPTEIQALAIPALMRGQGDHMLASHTGSGKTLAYLLPIVEALKKEERAGFVPRPRRPRAIVLGPTKELTEQIAGVAKQLSHHAKLRTMMCGSGVGAGPKTSQMDKLAGPMDLIVTTPTKLLEHIKLRHVFITDVRWLAIDEADTMFAEGWGEELATLLKPLKAKEHPARVVLVSATLTAPIQRLLSKSLPGVSTLRTHTTHRAITGSRHAFVHQEGGRDRLDLLTEVLAPDVRKGRKVLVFCNSVDSCRAVEHYCREQGMGTVCYHGAMMAGQRAEAMARFAGTAPATSAPSSRGGAADKGPQPDEGEGARARDPIMIATDVAARGLDFPGTVDHVVSFDFPFTAVDYIHRAGRTARAGRGGRVTSIVTARDKVLASRIKRALEAGEELDQLSGNPGVGGPSSSSSSSSLSSPATPPSKSLRPGGRPAERWRSSDTGEGGRGRVRGGEGSWGGVKKERSWEGERRGNYERRGAGERGLGGSRGGREQGERRGRDEGRERREGRGGGWESRPRSGSRPGREGRDREGGSRPWEGRGRQARGGGR